MGATKIVYEMMMNTINNYKRHMALIDDFKLNQMLQPIVLEEEVHLKTIIGL